MSKQLADSLELIRENKSSDPFDPVMPGAVLALIREAIDRIVWLKMRYRCNSCKFTWDVFASIGVEGPESLKDAALYVPAPFMTPCYAWPDMKRCGGHMRHINWQDDVELEPVQIAPDHSARFVLPRSMYRSDHGAEIEIPDEALLFARQYHNE